MSVGSINGRAIREIMEQLRRRGRQIEAAAKSALRESAAEIVQDAKSRAPVKTGNLRDSIHAIEENEGLSYKIVADAINEQGKQYAKIVEYSPKINKPYLFPAIEDNKNNINRRIAQAVRSEINE